MKKELNLELSRSATRAAPNGASRASRAKRCRSPSSADTRDTRFRVNNIFLIELSKSSGKSDL